MNGNLSGLHEKKTIIQIIIKQIYDRDRDLDLLVLSFVSSAEPLRFFGVILLDLLLLSALPFLALLVLLFLLELLFLLLLLFPPLVLLFLLKLLLLLVLLFSLLSEEPRRLGEGLFRPLLMLLYEGLLLLPPLLLLLLAGLLPLLGLLDLLRPLPPPRPPKPFLPPLLISTLTLFPQILVPSSSLQASSASRLSSISMKAKPGGFLATQTSETLPILPNASSMSNLLASLGSPPM